LIWLFVAGDLPLPQEHPIAQVEGDEEPSEVRARDGRPDRDAAIGVSTAALPFSAHFMTPDLSATPPRRSRRSSGNGKIDAAVVEQRLDWAGAVDSGLEGAELLERRLRSSG